MALVFADDEIMTAHSTQPVLPRTPPPDRTRMGARLFAALLCLGVMSACTLFVTSLCFLYFSRQSNSWARSEAETTSRWLAEWTAGQSESDRDALVAHAAAEFDSQAGLYHSSGAWVLGTRVLSLGPAEIAQSSVPSAWYRATYMSSDALIAWRRTSPGSPCPRTAYP